jgi:hypothetical protein
LYCDFVETLVQKKVTKMGTVTFHNKLSLTQELYTLTCGSAFDKLSLSRQLSIDSKYSNANKINQSGIANEKRFKLRSYLMNKGLAEAKK